MVELLISSQFRVFFHITLLFYQSSVTLFSREQKKVRRLRYMDIHTCIYEHRNKEWLKEENVCMYVHEWMDGWMVRWMDDEGTKNSILNISMYASIINIHSVLAIRTKLRAKKKKENFLHISPFACAIHSTKKDENKI